RQPELRLLRPRNRCDLQTIVRIGVEHRPAEQELQRNLARAEAIKILGDRDVEIECAMDRKLGKCASRKARHDNADMRPQESPKSLAPALRLAKEIAHRCLFLCRITASRYIDLDLAAQRHGMNHLSAIRIRNAKLQT